MIEHYLLSLIYYKKRTILSVIGVAIGVAILVIVLSLGKSLKVYTNKQMDIMGQKTLFIAPKPPELDEMGTMVSMVQGIRIRTLKEKDIEDIRKLPHVQAVTGDVVATEWIHYKSQEKQTMIMGVYPDYAKIDQSFEVIKGRIFRNSENNSLAKVVVIGYSVWQNIFKGGDPIGKYLKIKNMNFKVIGVLKKRGGFAFIDFDSSVFVPAKTLQKLILGINYFTEVDVGVDKIEHLEEVKQEISRILLRNHNIKNIEKKDFEIQTAQETVDKTMKITSILNILLGLLASISLLVGGVGIMNMMLIAIKERTKEIGLRKAVGARNFDIIFQFLSETVAITIVGSIFGVILGVGFSWLTFLAINKFGLSWPFQISYQSIIIGLALAIIDGLLFGLWPAYQAGKKDPIEALRG